MDNYYLDTGLNLIETLTTGMYPKSIVIFREYIQNACDAIDDAVKSRILGANNGEISIKIKRNKRLITIKDNGTGIPAAKFQSILSGIAVANKNLGSDNRGFRGIGKLCGLAYCRELRFVSTAKGEDIESTMIWHADKLREKFYTNQNYGLEVLNEIIEFDSKSGVDPNEHFFRVEMIDIVETDKDLLDEKKVIDYLSFVAPVEYDSDFGFQKDIHEYAAKLNFNISEYDISVNGDQLSKPYKTTFKAGRKNSDDIFNLAFRDFRDAHGNLIAWSWIGLSQFKGVIDYSEDMRGIRLRAGNIQLGDESALQRFFPRGENGTKFFIGEVHAVDKGLIPNGRRDYFVQNTACNTFEAKLKTYFEELYKLYYDASQNRNLYKAVNKPAQIESAFQQQPVETQQSNKAQHDWELAKANVRAEKAQNQIDERRQTAQKEPETMASQVFKRISEEASKKQQPKPFKPKTSSSTPKPVEKPEPVDTAPTSTAPTTSTISTHQNDSVNNPPRSVFRRRIGRLRKPSFTMRSTK